MHVQGGLLLLLLSGGIKGALTTDDPDPPIGGHHKAGSESLHLKHPTRAQPFLPFSKLGAPAGPETSKGPGESGPLPESGLSHPYTTLDKLRKGPSKQELKRGPFKKHTGALGGLHPDEVFYADEDILILKGGGYRGEPYDDSLRTKATRRFTTTVPATKGGSSPLTAASQQFTAFSLFFPSSAPRGIPARFNHVYLIIPQLFLTTQGGRKPPNQPLRANQKEPHPNIPEPGAIPLATPHKTSPLLQQSLRGELTSLSDSPFTGGPPPEGGTFPQPPSLEGPLDLHATGDVPPSSAEVRAGHSLAGDTDVNELLPRPPINPDAEVFLGGPHSGARPRGRIPK